MAHDRDKKRAAFRGIGIERADGRSASTDAVKKKHRPPAPFANPAAASEPSTTLVMSPLNPSPTTATIQPTLVIRAGSASEVGPRECNEDFSTMSEDRGFFAVSDGIGGAPYGDIMSKIACNAALDCYRQGGDVLTSFEFANSKVSDASFYLAKRSGATLLLAQFHANQLRLAWVGDTLAYRIRDGEMLRLTSPNRVTPASNALSQAVGYGPVTPSHLMADVRAGDRYLLCTDGVWEYLPMTAISRILTTGTNATFVAEQIAQDAADCGSDNSTCICVMVDGAQHASKHELPDSSTPAVTGEAATGCNRRE